MGGIAQRGYGWLQCIGSGNNCIGKGMVMRIVVGEMVVARV